MAQHIYFDRSGKYGHQLGEALDLVESSDLKLDRVRQTMLYMRDGDGSDPAHYDEVRERFGFETNEAAKAAFDEIDSGWSKTSGDGQVSFVKTARLQMVNKLR